MGQKQENGISMGRALLIALLVISLPLGTTLLILGGTQGGLFGRNDSCEVATLYLEVDDGFYVTSYQNNGFLLDEQNTSFYIGNVVGQTMRIDPELFNYMLDNPDWNETINETDFMSLTGFSLFVAGHSSLFPDNFIDESNVSLDGLNATFGFPLVTMITSIIVDVYYENGTLLESDPFLVVIDDPEILTNATILKNQTFVFDECGKNIDFKINGARYNATSDELDELYTEINGIETTLDRGYGFFSP